nr:MAG TPA: hypothetical protein [Caudoviricetes sp.]
MHLIVFQKIRAESGNVPVVRNGKTELNTVGERRTFDIARLFKIFSHYAGSNPEFLFKNRVADGFSAAYVCQHFYIKYIQKNHSF